MSTFFNNNQHQHRAPSQKPWQKPWFLPAAIGVTALLLGIGIGSAGEPEPVVQQVPGPERVVTKTVEKEVEVAPVACLTALDLSEQGFSYAAEAMGYMGDALTAAGNVDVAGLTKANDDIAIVSPKLKALTAPMKSASAECRAAAK